jgi:class 3 adenylate cyclase
VADPSAPRADQPDERRNLTVLFSDLVGSTELATQLDPEDLHEVIEAYQRAVAAVVDEHGGVVAQFQGDGVVAYFGYPVAIESAGRDAVSAGLAIVERVSRLRGDLPAELALPDLFARVGIHTGEVVMAAVRAGGANRIADVFGEVPNLAARLQGVAQPGQVIVSDVTARLVSGYFVMESVGALTLRGISREVPASLVRRPSSARRRLETGPLTNYVARQRESDWLHEHWESVQEGPARAVVVTGEPGIGKSRLLQEFAGVLSDRGAPIAPIYCGRRDALSPLYPFGPLMGEVPVDPDDAVAWVMDRASDRPMLLLVEDAHWADPSTIEVVDQVARSHCTVLEVLTARPEFFDDQPTLTPHRLDLDRLHPDDALAVIWGVPGGDQLTEEMTRALVERADGVPLFLEELTRAVMDGTSDLGGSPGIPATLTEVIAARLDRLGEAKQTAQLAAIIGRAFDRQTLQRVSGLDLATIDGHLQHLMDQAVVEAPEPDGRLWFRHALIHEAAYHSVLRAERRRAHSQVAEHMMEASLVEAQPETVAYHLGAAGRASEAVETWRLAARTARRNARFREAAGHERELLELLPQLPDDQREVTELASRSRLTMCLTAVDQAQPAVMEEGMKVQELARRLGDRETLLMSLLVLLPWWQANGDFASADVAMPEAMELAVESQNGWAEQVLAQFAGANWVWQGKVAEGVAMMESSFEASGLPLVEDLPLLPTLSAAVAEIVLASTRILAALGCWLMGRVTDGHHIRADTIRFTDDSGVPQAQAVTAATGAIMAQLDGDRDLVLSITQGKGQSGDDVTTRQWRQWIAVLRWWSGEGSVEPEIPGPMLRPYFSMLLADHPDTEPQRGLSLLYQAEATARRTGELFCLPEILRVRGELHRRLGDPVAADQDFAAAIAVAQSSGLRMLELRALTSRVLLPGSSPQGRVELETFVATLQDQESTLSMGRAEAALEHP